VGEWTIHVSDQRRETAHGVFLGWTMSIFGSVQDENKPFKPYTVELVEDVLPPTPAPQAPPSTTSGTGTPTKTLPKPTDQLPTDHGDAEGEAHKPAFPATSSSNSTASTSPSPVAGAADTTATPTADEGWFSDLSNLVSNQVWFFVALGAVILFISCAGWFFWRRAVRARRAKENYTSLAADDEMGMSSLGKSTRSASGGPQRTKELYDAFGEVSDDEEDADESTGLRPHVHTPGVEMGLHSGFLDDDEPSTAGSAIIGRYRDEPAPQPGHQRADSPGSGSGSSWEHAS
jgi:kexin